MQMLYKFVSVIIVVEVHPVEVVTLYILQLFTKLCRKVFLFFLVCISIDIKETSQSFFWRLCIDNRLSFIFIYDIRVDLDFPDVFVVEIRICLVLATKKFSVITAAEVHIIFTVKHSTWMFDIHIYLRSPSQ